MCLFVCTVQLILLMQHDISQHDVSQREERKRPGLLCLLSFKEKEMNERAAFLSSVLSLSSPTPPLDLDPSLPLKGEEETRDPLFPPPRGKRRRTAWRPSPPHRPRHRFFCLSHSPSSSPTPPDMYSIQSLHLDECILVFIPTV